LTYIATESGLSESSKLYGTSPTMTVHIPIKMSNEIIVDPIVAKGIDRAIGGLAS
jgi:hypothetical protein